jgi:hypothetical protein
VEKLLYSLVDVLIHYDVDSSSFFEQEKLSKCVQALLDIGRSKDSLTDEMKRLEEDFEQKRIE